MADTLPRVQPFDSADEFHQHLSLHNAKHGKGDVVAVVWSNYRHPVHGLCVCQLQYGMVSFSFRVQHSSNGYTLVARGHRNSVVSTYFLKSIST